MKASLLIKVLDAMSYNCRGKSLSLTFYESPQKSRVSYAKSRKEFDSYLPGIYYVAEVSLNKKTLFVKKKSGGLDRMQDMILTEEENFNFDSFLQPEAKEYEVHEYREASSFSKEHVYDGRSEWLRKYEECLKYDAMLFIGLFKLMGGTVSLVIESEGKHYLGHYADGKVIIVTMTTNGIGVRVEDFYTLKNYLPGFEIVDFVQYPYTLGKNKYLHELHQFCEAGSLYYEEL